MGKSNGPAGPNTSKSARNPQRIVLLTGDEDNEVKSVLAEYPGADLDKVCHRARREVCRSRVAGRLGWRRFLWCRR